jgi:hypothetical protein
MFTPSTIFLAKRIVRLASIILELILSHILRQTIDLSSNVASYISNGKCAGGGREIFKTVTERY